MGTTPAATPEAEVEAAREAEEAAEEAAAIARREVEAAADMAAPEIGVRVAAITADLSDIVYLEDVQNEVKMRGLVPVANGTTADLRWCVADGVTGEWSGGQFER